MRRCRRFLEWTYVIVALAQLAGAWEIRDAVEREYQHPVAAVRAALQQVGGGNGSRLPSLEGFIKVEGIRIEDYERPYYEYKFDVEQGSAGQAVVKVRAHVSAWYVGPDKSISGYRNLESNGRLEADLLDRLDEYLRTKSTDPAVLSQEIVQLRAQRKEVESRIAQLEQAQTSQHDAMPSVPDLVIVGKPRIPIRRARRSGCGSAAFRAGRRVRSAGASRRMASGQAGRRTQWMDSAITSRGGWLFHATSHESSGGAARKSRRIHHYSRERF